MRVVTVGSPRGEYAFGKTVFAGTANVIHDLVVSIFNDRFTNTPGDIVERRVPGCLFPFPFATFAGAFEWKENAIRIVNLIQRRRTFGAIAPAGSGVFGIAFKLLNFAGDFVDVRKQATGRLAVEARRRNERVVSFLPAWPSLRVEFSPVVPTFLRWKRGEMVPAGTGIESFRRFAHLQLKLNL